MSTDTCDIASYNMIRSSISLQIFTRKSILIMKLKFLSLAARNWNIWFNLLVKLEKGHLNLRLRTKVNFMRVKNHRFRQRSSYVHRLSTSFGETSLYNASKDAFFTKKSEMFYRFLSCSYLQ